MQINQNHVFHLLSYCFSQDIEKGIMVTNNKLGQAKFSSPDAFIKHMEHCEKYFVVFEEREDTIVGQSYYIRGLSNEGKLYRQQNMK